LGKAENDSLQRVYGVSFPDEKKLEAHLQNLKEAKENDHRVRGKEQELFFFHHLSPGSAFFEPAGARIYNRLIEYIRAEYRIRGYQEVVSPNMYNVELWKTSGHWEHYAKNMFSFTDGEDGSHSCGHDHGDHDHHETEPAVDESGMDEAAKKKAADKRKELERRREMSTFALKPMNCPGHCLIFANRDRSYRELPLRMADFGVLHRNELSGALTGLTRVRRFQQDDAHIFCQKDQIKQEVVGALNFMKSVYDTFGMTYKLERSTRPAKATGLDTPEGLALWDDAEQQLADAMNEFAGVGTWRDNPGDGAFYGPKIDIKVFDAQGRMHQCATVQLDFQLPIRFNLDYISHQQKRERPVMVHRAMLGSVERFIAILLEHFRGRWPFWLSPRQVMVVPMIAGSEEDNKAATLYAQEVAQALREFYVELPNSANDHHNDAIKKAFDLGTKFCLCIGPAEVKNRSVSVEGRQPYGSTAKGPVHFGICSLDSLVVWLRAVQRERTLDENLLKLPEAPAFQRQSYEKGQNKKEKKQGGDQAKAAPTTAKTESPSSPSKKKASEPAQKRRQDELQQPAAGTVAPVAAPPSVPQDKFYVGDDSYPTAVPSLKGKRFASMEEFLVSLNKKD
jgi:threonyl-tRNA synthetase